MKKSLLLLVSLTASAFAAEITGFVGDSSCGNKHADASASSAACAERCVKRGDAPVLVTKEGQVYKIEKASAEKVSKLIGKTVTVTGDVKDDTITIASVK